MKLELKPVPCDCDPRAISRMEGIRYYEEEIDGFLRSWEEYVPTTYDPSQKYPLVIDVHGGREHNASWARPWSHVAEREGFLVLYPHSVVNGVTWNVFRDLSREDGMPDDVAYIDALLQKMFAKYNVDRQRLYIHGQSMGDMMVTTYLRERAYLFAAAAPLSGPSGPMHSITPEQELILPVDSLPVIRTHGSRDLPLPMGRRRAPTAEMLANRAKFTGFGKPSQRQPDPAWDCDEWRKDKMELQVGLNNRTWIVKNGCDPHPRLSLRGKFAVATYAGDPCDVHFLMVEGGDHNPNHQIHDAIWRYFFTGFKRVDGKIVRTRPEAVFTPDKDAVVLADGAARAYVDNQVVEMEAPARQVGEAMYVPVSFLEKSFPQLKVQVSDKTGTGGCVRITEGKNELQLATGMLSCLYNQIFREIARTLILDDKIYVSIADIASIMLGKQASQGRGICYISDVPGCIGYDFAYLIRSVLGLQSEPSNQELLQREQEHLRQRESRRKEGGRA